ncbi:MULTISPECIES: hypothetical protein [unclassified Nocardioides]|uniref:hypothetical protein n=1 Tax=unclassified Nocardioides TaxID=2615069 RepID=UPI000056FED9|nr:MULTISPECIES: hypothetical protein [unclassified Nocardioides]ABL80088.1 hypothetical protein Noca_0546 [Nocardioides sp. JS614]
MNESSRSLSTTTCPDWCIDNDHSQEVNEQLGDGPLHQGPAFGGRLRAWGLDDADGRTLSIDFEDRSDFGTPEQLRALAQAAEEAARWLEEQGMSHQPPAGSADRAPAPRLLDALALREAEGFLTIDEAAERYGIDRGVLAAEAAAGRVGTVSLRFDDTIEATFLPTHDEAVAAWLEAHR